ncbi:MAG: AraC family transcriptional regulator [Blautia sp.]|nr:AraC family transcriptional regulator [Blautia sp.]
MANSYQYINQYLNFLLEKYNIQICIKDFYGFIPINKELDEALQPFLAHTNPFCMYIKSEMSSYHTCLRMIRQMYEKFESGNFDCYYGVCHAGLGEYVIPIRSTKLLLGSVNAGFFQKNEHLADWCIRRACKASSSLSYETAKSLYQYHISSATIYADELLPHLHLLAEYLGHTYEILEKTHPDMASAYRYHNSNEDAILSHAFEYIRQNCLQHISVEELAKFCHCSSSYLSHIFKKRTSVNINTYINKIRIERSKNYLLNSGETIAEIAISTGFNDPNYYSRVFTKIIGISPTEFRRRFKNEII